MNSFGLTFQVVQPVASRKLSSECCAARIPLLTEQLFRTSMTSSPTYQASSIEVVNPTTDAWYYVELQEAAAWILSGVHWFSTLEQPMMIAMIAI